MLNEVLSGVRQGSVLGSILFLLFVNDLLEWIRSSMKMFADNLIVCHKIKTMSDKEALQEDLNMLAEWSQKWMLRFNRDKCKVMHVRHSEQTQYYMSDELGREVLQSIHERELGVLVRSDLVYKLKQKLERSLE